MTKLDVSITILLVTKFRATTVLCILLLFVSFPSSGCTCDTELKDKELIAKAEYAFLGQVVSNIYKDEWTETFIGSRTDALVRVKRVYKGKIVGDDVYVISSRSSSCEVELFPGKHYLFTGRDILKIPGSPPFSMPPPFENDQPSFRTQ